MKLKTDRIKEDLEWLTAIGLVIAGTIAFSYIIVNILGLPPWMPLTFYFLFVVLVYWKNIKKLLGRWIEWKR